MPKKAKKLDPDEALDELAGIGSAIVGLEDELAGLYAKRNVLFGRLRQEADLAWETIAAAAGVTKQAAIRAWQRAKPS